MATYGRQGTGGSGGGGGGTSPLSTALAYAQALKASLTCPLFYEDFAYNPGNSQSGNNIAWGTILVGTGSSTQVTTLASGVLLNDSGATANSSAMAFAAGNATANLIVAPASNPFYASVRARLTGTGNAVSQHIPITISPSGFGEYIQFSMTNGVWQANMFKSGGSNLNLTSAVAGDFSNAHDYAVGFDGTTISFFIDGVVVPGLTTTNISQIPVGNCLFGSYVGNGATAASRQMYIDSQIFITTPLT